MAELSAWDSSVGVAGGSTPLPSLPIGMVDAVGAVDGCGAGEGAAPPLALMRGRAADAGVGPGLAQLVAALTAQDRHAMLLLLRRGRAHQKGGHR